MTQPVVSEVVERLGAFATELKKHWANTDAGGRVRIDASLLMKIGSGSEEAAALILSLEERLAKFMDLYDAARGDVVVLEARATRAETLLAGLEGAAREPAHSASGAHALGEARHADTIESAPRDGQWIIGWRMNFRPFPTRWHPASAPGGNGFGWWGGEPTHWLPFPTEQDFEEGGQ